MSEDPDGSDALRSPSTPEQPPASITEQQPPAPGTEQQPPAPGTEQQPPAPGTDQQGPASITEEQPSGPRNRGTVLQSKKKRLRIIWGLIPLTAAISAFSIFYAYKTLISQNEVPKIFALSPGNTVFVINILSQLIRILLLHLLGSIFEALRWAKVSGQHGVLTTVFLALGNATPLSGLGTLMSTIGIHQFWAFQRYFLFSYSRHPG